MGLSPWLTFRQAKDAIRNGRPEEAHRLLLPLAAEGYRKAGRLLREVAAAYVGRAEKSHRADNTENAWKDLLAAEALNTGDIRVSQLRTALTRIGMAECSAALEAGKPLHVLTAAEKLRSRSIHRPDLDAMQTIAQDWVMANEMADRGDFLLAKTMIERIRSRLAMIPTAGLDAIERELDKRHERFRVAIGHLSDAAEARQWSAAAKWAGEVIAAAPNNREGRTIQLKAWEHLQPTTGSYVPTPTDAPIIALAAAANPLAGAAAALGAFGQSPTIAHPANGNGNGSSVKSSSREERPVVDSLRNSTIGGMPKRFLLWVDGVGGYLVCLSNRVSFGQATADAPIDVPLFADVSRMHAEISRDGEGYVVESSRGLHVNGQISERSGLKCGDRVTLGTSCQFVFRQPVSISPTTRLELVSGHRLPLAVDGVILMAENLILGPGNQSHVVLPWAASNIILYRSKDGIGVKYAGSFTVDNSPCRERANLTLPVVVSSEQFSFALEPVGARL
jgi:hypothetical protein